MKLGNVELYLVSDGEFLVDGGGQFGLVPKVLWSQFFTADELNRVPTALYSLLIVSDGKRILVDTGFGRKLTPKECEIQGLQRPQGDLLDALQRLGLAPTDIDIVINTHLHGDHASGNTLLRNGVAVPAFPNAQYWIQRLEWADAMYPDERTRNTYHAQNLVPIQEAGQLRLLLGDTRVTGEVRCQVTRGHTRAHQSVMIQSADESAMFLGDMASLAIRLERLGWMSAFDTEPLETLETKRAIRDWALEKRALLFFQHDLRTPMGYLVQEGDSYRVKPVPSR
jgi:glyoxylase-like metal-dependent hydrolase (beta-lactamase superfamily II)